ncbi:alpha/beta hydrolase (plasmid) [Rhodococcoides fascians A21d2]|uniref:alpha/beta fold hydrolase n=1 Tax=Rhodococcoides fascians TaxID=1828 RepID=UPI000568668F|nr:alpha/beta hydrolase [Rhodococcus fascians]QII03647.1 alpha/beta hydrolase [Rhodococcus fascians A21d2]
MSFRWPVDVDELFDERFAQMTNTGLPVDDVVSVRNRIDSMWAEGPGGWVSEWSVLAHSYAEAGAHLQASLAYGWAKFPCLADPAKHAALAAQLEQYELAAPNFGVQFERRVVTVEVGKETTAVPIHLFAVDDLAAERPVLMISGGVDTWKMDIHGLAMVMTMGIVPAMTVLAFDIPGTGESSVPMSGSQGGAVVESLVAIARDLGNGTVVHFGMSMGGYFSARTGLSAAVDAAVVLGGPVCAAFSGGVPEHFGMNGIVGNALGFDHEPTEDEAAPVYAEMTLAGLLDRDENSPMLVINGADDVHVPQSDTTVFRNRRDTEVHLIPDAGHCAISELSTVLTLTAEWMTRTVPRLTSTTQSKP